MRCEKQIPFRVQQEKQVQQKKQIPFGNDKPKSNSSSGSGGGNCNCRSKYVVALRMAVYFADGSCFFIVRRLVPLVVV